MSALPLIALALLSAAPPRWTTRECPRGEGGRSSRGIPCGAAEEPTYLEFAPLSGAGLPVAENLCDALAAEVPGWSTPVDGGAGNWCLGGDGQEVAGSEVDFEPFGSPTPVSVTVCPSGPDCSTKSALSSAAVANIYLQAASNPPGALGPFTVCHLVSNDASAAFVDSIRQTSEWYLVRNSGQSGQYGLYVGGVTQYGPTMTQVAGAINLHCGVYQANTRLRAYNNGEQGAESTTATRGNTSGSLYIRKASGEDVHFGAFYVDQELSAAQIAAIARRVLADQPKALVRGSPSLALTYTRTGSMFCSKADNTGSILPANRPCISQNGILVEAAATNLVVRSQEFDNAAWLKNGTPVTANYGLAPDGTKTAERFTVTAGGNQFAYGNATGTAGANTFSVFVKSISGALTFPVCAYAGGASYTCNSCAISTSAVTRCSVTVTATTDWRYLIGDYYVDNLARDVIVWGAQSETGSVATSYIPTTSAAATRGAALVSFAHSQPTYATGCIAITTDWAAAPSDNVGLVTLSSGSTFKQSILTFSGLKGYIGGSSVVSTSAPGTGGSHRYIFSWQPSGSLLTFDTSATSGAAGTPAATDTLRIGNYDATATTVQSGRYSRIQFDPNPSRCR